MTYTSDNMERMLGNLATNADAERFANYLISKGWELEEDSEGQVVAFKGGQEMTEQEWQESLGGYTAAVTEYSDGKFEARVYIKNDLVLASGKVEAPTDMGDVLYQ